MTTGREPYATKRGNLVRYSATSDRWIIAYRPVGASGYSPVRMMYVDDRAEGVAIIDKMEADGNA